MLASNCDRRKLLDWKGQRERISTRARGKTCAYILPNLPCACPCPEPFCPPLPRSDCKLSKLGLRVKLSIDLRRPAAPPQRRAWGWRIQPPEVKSCFKTRNPNPANTSGSSSTARPLEFLELLETLGSYPGDYDLRDQRKSASAAILDILRPRRIAQPSRCVSCRASTVGS